MDKQDPALLAAFVPERNIISSPIKLNLGRLNSSKDSNHSQGEHSDFVPSPRL